VTTERTPQELKDLGLYDPDAPDAEERLALLTLALECNATIDDIRCGIEEGRLHAVGAERIVLGGSETITLDEAITRSGIDREFAIRLWRALGFVVPEPDMRVCTDRDVGVFEYFALTEAVFGPGPAIALARTAGNSLARLADGAISNARSVLEAPLRSEGGRNIDVARTFVEAASAIIPPLYPVIETVHRHHLVDAARASGFAAREAHRGRDPLRLWGCRRSVGDSAPLERGPRPSADAHRYRVGRGDHSRW